MSTTPHIVLNDASIAEIAAARGLVVIRYQDGSVKIWDNESDSPALTSVAPGNIVKIAAGTIKYYQDWLRVYVLLDANGMIKITHPVDELRFDEDEDSIPNLIINALQGHAANVFVTSEATHIVHTNGNVYAMNLEKAELVHGRTAIRHITGGKSGKHHWQTDDDLFYTVYLYADGSISVDGSDEHNPPAHLGPVTAIAASESHIIALKHDGTVVAWGDNSKGACGVPTDLGLVVAVAVGDHFSVVLLADGQVRGWGDNSKGQYNFPSDLPNVRQICTSFDETYVLTESGSVIRSH